MRSTMFAQNAAQKRNEEYDFLQKHLHNLQLLINGSQKLHYLNISQTRIAAILLSPGKLQQKHSK